MTAWDFGAAPFEWVIYHPPKSRGFGHGSRIRGVVRAWENAKQFLSDLTDASLPQAAELTCRPAGKWLPEEMAIVRREAAFAKFGPPYSEDDANGAKWQIDPTRLDEAFEFEASAPKSEKERFDPSTLYFHIKFRWRKPWAGSGVESLGESGLGVHASGQKLFIQPHFVFLTSLESSAFREQLLAVEHAAPFKFNDSYFKRWVITPKRGNMGRILKAPIGWRDAWKTS